MTERKSSGGSRAVALVLWGTVALLVALIVVFGAVMKKKAALKEEIEEQPEKAAAVSTMVIQRQTVPDEIRLPGRIEPFREALVATERGGRVTKVLVREGDRVFEGDVLLRLNQALWDTQSRQASIEKREAEKALTRWKELKMTGAVSDTDFEAVETRLDVARVAMAAAQVAIDQCAVLAPFSGLIDGRYLEVGEFAPEGAAAFHLVDMSSVKLVVNVPERDIKFLSEAMSIPFTVDSLSDEVYTGTVSFVSHAAAPQSNAFRVEALVGNPQHALKAGMIARARLLRRMREDAIVVPLSAIIAQKGDDVAYVVVGDRVVRRIVRLDTILAENAVVASGIRPGDVLVTAGHRTLQDGMLVEVKNADVPAPPEAVPESTAGEAKAGD